MKQGFYLIGPKEPYSAEQIIEAVRKTAETRTVDAFLYTMQEPPSNEHIELMKKVCMGIQKINIAFILNGHLELAVKNGCDGAQIPFVPEIAKIRKKYPEMAIGVVCTTRHQAMTAGEADVDYIVFDGENILENTLWWSELFTVTSVLFNPESPPAEVDFIAVPLKL